MFKFRFVLVFLFFFFTLAEAGTSVDALSHKLKSFRTYSAQFDQTTVNQEGEVVQKSSGRVSIMPPGQFRWETIKPTHQFLITDGKTLWIYDVDLEQATEEALNKKVTINPASILSGSIVNLEENFIVHEKKTNMGEVFSLLPRKNSLDFKEIRLVFEGDKLLEMQVDNNLDETTNFKFSHIQLNKPMSPSLFKFKAPANVDVVKQ